MSFLSYLIGKPAKVSDDDESNDLTQSSTTSSSSSSSSYPVFDDGIPSVDPALQYTLLETTGSMFPCSPYFSFFEVKIDPNAKFVSPNLIASEWARDLHASISATHKCDTDAMKEIKGIDFPVHRCKSPGGAKMWYSPPLDGSTDLRPMDNNSPMSYHFHSARMSGIYDENFALFLRQTDMLRESVVADHHLSMYYEMCGGNEMSEVIVNTVYLSNRGGLARMFDRFPDAKIVTISLEYIPPSESEVTAPFLSRVAESYHAPLTDAWPLSQEPLSCYMSQEACEQLFCTVKNVAHSMQRNPTWKFFIHCAQGQSRTFVFTFLLFYYLIRAGQLKIGGPGSYYRSSSELSYAILTYLMRRRPFLLLA